MMSHIPEVIGITDHGEPRLWWTGPDDRGVELEVGAIFTTEKNDPAQVIVLVNHVFPIALRRKL